MESKQKITPPADLAADLDVERVRLGSIEALADAVGLNRQTVARIILREPVLRGSVALARSYIAARPEAAR